MFYVYILQSLISGSYYIGNCDKLENRIKQHNDGKVKSIKACRPWWVVHQEIFNTRNGAVKRERQLKSWKSRKAIEKMIKKHF